MMQHNSLQSATARLGEDCAANRVGPPRLIRLALGGFVKTTCIGCVLALVLCTPIGCGQSTSGGPAARGDDSELELERRADGSIGPRREEAVADVPRDLSEAWALDDQPAGTSNSRGFNPGSRTRTPSTAQTSAMDADIRPSGRADRGTFTPTSRASSGEPAWTIVVAMVAARDECAAQRALDAVRDTAKLDGARLVKLRDRGDAGVYQVIYGSYPSSGDRQAVRDLDRIRSVELANGRRPYADAFMKPPADSTLHGSNAEYDLRNAKEIFGEDAAKYTLQIGAYGRDDERPPSQSDLAEFRKAAESATAQLRSEGELAFYYHGPTMSLVTVGVFNERDHTPSGGTAIESAELRDARRRHPHNLFNGKGITERFLTEKSGRQQALQRSRLVAIPEN